jgi:hypothetical protein
LHHARLLDHIMNGEETEDEAVLRDLLQKRNHSILAHGLQPIEKKSTVRFLEYVDALVEAPEAGVGAEHAREGIVGDGAGKGSSDLTGSGRGTCEEERDEYDRR